MTRRARGERIDRALLGAAELAQAAGAWASVARIADALGARVIVTRLPASSAAERWRVELTGAQPASAAGHTLAEALRKLASRFPRAF